jgi:hypothetical protein
MTGGAEYLLGSGFAPAAVLHRMMLRGFIGETTGMCREAVCHMGMMSALFVRTGS